MFDTNIFDTLESVPPTRRWTTAFSFLLQAVAVTVLLLIPLLYTDALPSLHYVEQLTVPAGRAQQRPIEVVATQPQHGSGTSEFVNNVLVQPPRIPTSLPPINDLSATPLAPPDPYTVFNSTGPSSTNQSSALQRLLAHATPPPPRPDVRQVPLRVSVLSEGALLRRVQPVYPGPARAARIQGPVVLAALIDTEGRIVNLRLVSGNPLLVQAAIDSVRQWRYRPYILNNHPIEVETQITVVFSLK